MRRLAIALVFAVGMSSAGISADETARPFARFVPGGAAIISDQSLTLTTTTWQSGSAFLEHDLTLRDMGSFKVAFTFQITDPAGISDDDGQGADGITFALHVNSGLVGASGGGIGYAGMKPSLAVEFDTWNNGPVDQNNGNHIGVDLNGDIASTLIQPIGGRFNDGSVWHAWIDYDGVARRLEVRCARNAGRPAQPIVSTSIDLAAELDAALADDDIMASPVFVGFTSGTGAAGNRHVILSWAFSPDPGWHVGRPE